MRLALLPALALVAGCGLRQVDPDFRGLPADADPARFTCCHDPERYPEAFVDLSLSVAPVALVLNPLDIGDRPGLLTGKTEAHAHITETARPLDLVLLSNKSYIGGRMVPGRFTHSAVYLGSEAELRQVGLWDTPEFLPLHDEIRAGKVFIEAVRPLVRMVTPQELLQVDAVALLRPDLNLSVRRRAAKTLISKLGLPFDYWFDNRTPDVLACTELIGLAMPELDFTITTAYGRPAAMPDDVVAQAIRGENMTLVEHIRGVEGGGYVIEDARPVMEDIAAFWGPDPGA